VYRDEAAHQERLQHVRLDLLHQDDDAEHEQRGEGSLGHQRHQHRDGTRHEGTDHRDEGAEEHQHADGTDERHPEHGGTDHDADRIRRRHQDGGPHELCE